MIRFLFATALMLAALLAPAAAQDAPDAQNGAPRVHALLVAEQGSAKPGGSVTIALEEQIRPGWHTYWVNPGDAGAPTEIAWTLPAGWQAGAIQWPTPKRLPVFSLMDYGYEGKLWLLTKIAVPATAHAGDTITLKAAVSWLVCKDVCVPEDVALTLPLTIGDGAPDPKMARDFAAARAAMPVASPWPLTFAVMKASGSDAALDLYAAAPALVAAHPRDVAFFPLKPGMVKNAAPQTIAFAKDGLVLRLKPGTKIASVGRQLDGVLVLTSSDGSVQALTVAAPPGAVPQGDFGGGSGDITLVLAIAFAFLGGLILNAMPCVLPILAMKALALAGHAGREKNEAAREGFAYAAGAILSFVAFGLVIVGLRQGGAAIGWGFQLQSPIAVAGFALLIFAVALNLSGLFEVGSVTAGDSLAQRSGPIGAFFTGVLAVAVAAPCTAPFMAAALGFALTLPMATALLIFLSLGIGFALPFLLLGLWPRALSFLPKPGTWMLRLKQFLAFPMYGAAAWLVWVLATESGPNAVAIVLAAMLALALAAWLWGATRDLAGTGRGIGLAASLLILVGGLAMLALLGGPVATPPASVTAGADHFSDSRLASLRAAGRPVFVDATAAWCITCLVNEQAVLSRGAVKNAFADKHVAYLVADWTNNDPEITRLLSANGRSGVPMYLFYAPGADKPVILPQILTEAGVLSVLGGG